MRLIRDNLINRLPKGYKDALDSWNIYWTRYGKWKALIGSPYLLLAVVTSAICYPLWFGLNDCYWFDLTLSIIPNMLGFTLGGYAILLAFSNRAFVREINKPDENNNSLYQKANVTFVHFIVIQVLSLAVAVVARAWPSWAPVLGVLGFTLLCYALYSAIAAALVILQLARVFGVFALLDDD